MTRFGNPHLPGSYPTFRDFLLWKMGFYAEKNEHKIHPGKFVYPSEPPLFCKEKPCAMWIGHSSFLCSVGGVNILTDPVWGTYCSPVPFPSLKRNIKPPISLHELPRINYVLISHNHYDHLELKTVLYLKNHQPHIQWIIPKGLSSWFMQRGISKITELNWWESSTLPEGVVTAVPSQHFSGRTFWDRNKTGWNGYVLEIGEKKLYFVGDTGYNSWDFKEVGYRWNGVHLSLIPIGAYTPRKFMQSVHIDPMEAVQIHEDALSSFSVGMHWNTFQLSDESFEAPPYDLYLAMKEKNIPFHQFIPVKVGTYFNW